MMKMKTKNWTSKFIALAVVCLVIGVGIGLLGYHYLYSIGMKLPEESPTQLVITVAKEHLQKYVHNAFPNVDFFSMVKKVEVVEGECEANKYWENWGQPPIESPPKHQCWIVKFYYYGPAEGSHLVVYVDKNTNEVIGGTQTK